MKRFPASLYGVGEEPDPRFTLANERTFLAWIRTSGALFALALAIDAFDVAMTGWVRDLTVVVLSLGALLGALAGWRSWAKTEKALRLSEPLPSSSPNLTMAAVISLVLVLFVVDSVVRALS